MSQAEDQNASKGGGAFDSQRFMKGVHMKSLDTSKKIKI